MLFELVCGVDVPPWPLKNYVVRSLLPDSELKQIRRGEEMGIFSLAAVVATLTMTLGVGYVCAQQPSACSSECRGEGVLKALCVGDRTSFVGKALIRPAGRMQLPRGSCAAAILWSRTRWTPSRSTRLCTSP